jgi:hypothetical protein
MAFKGVICQPIGEVLNLKPPHSQALFIHLMKVEVLDARWGSRHPIAANQQYLCVVAIPKVHSISHLESQLKAAGR